MECNHNLPSFLAGHNIWIPFIQILRDALVFAHTELKRAFWVLVLIQNFMRTKALFDDLERSKLDHILIREYDLNHFPRSAGKRVTGAVSVTQDNQAVQVVGTANVVSLCHWYHVPVYLFVESIKFAHKPLLYRHMYNKDQDRTKADITLHMKTFSDDFVDVAMVTHFITEMGEVSGPTK